MARSSRGSGFRRSSGSSRRKTAWGLGPGSEAVTNMSSSAAGFVGGFVVPTIPGLTIARIRGRLRAFLTLGTNPGDGFAGAFGIGIATETAINAGIASVPTPINEMESENWLYWTPFYIFSPVVSSTEANSPTMDFSIEIDTKAMRKFPEDMAVYAALEVVEVGTATGQMWFESRVLALLP